MGSREARRARRLAAKQQKAQADNADQQSATVEASGTTLNEESLARFVAFSDATKVAQVKEVLAAKMDALEIKEAPELALPLPGADDNFVGAPSVNVRSLLDQTDPKNIQTIVATINQRL